MTSLIATELEKVLLKSSFNRVSETLLPSSQHGWLWLLHKILVILQGMRQSRGRCYLQESSAAATDQLRDILYLCTQE